MDDLNITTFVDNTTVITAAFLNDLQIYIQNLKEYVDSVAVRTVPQVFLYNDDRNNVIPTRHNATDTISAQGLLPNIDVIAGDILLGVNTGTIGEVTENLGQFFTVKGLGIHT